MSYVALEYLPDLDLETWRHNNPVIESLEDTMRLFFSQLLEGIVSLHEMGITHRDLKPPNVLLRRSSMWTEERGKKSILVRSLAVICSFPSFNDIFNRPN